MAWEWKAEGPGKDHDPLLGGVADWEEANGFEESWDDVLKQAPILIGWGLMFLAIGLLVPFMAARQAYRQWRMGGERVRD